MTSVRVPQPFPCQGSKRRLAPAILAHFPPRMGRLIEPFAGSGAVSLACAATRRASAFALNDLSSALCGLWEQILTSPDALSDAYEALWLAQSGREREFYDVVRDRFNETQRPEYLLYLLARCVKASVRYNAGGQFNQSLDNRRLGMRPAMKRSLEATSRLLAGRTRVTSLDYREALSDATPDDLVYMDPPYQGVGGNRDPRYIEGVPYREFAETLADLCRRRISFAVSYDGRLGPREYGRPLPASLDLTRIELEAGRSTQSTLLGADHVTYESLYLSPALVARTERRYPRAQTPAVAQLVLPGA